MRCLKCGGTYQTTKGSLKLNDKIIGSFNVHNVEYRKCTQCHKLRYPANTAYKIEETKKQIKNRLIGKLPVTDFIGASAAAKILNKSRQAMHKHRRIRRGFIYSIRHEGRILYHKRSVLDFKETGDGRFKLSRQINKTETKYIFVHKFDQAKELVWDEPATFTSRKSIKAKKMPAIFSQNKQSGFRKMGRAI